VRKLRLSSDRKQRLLAEILPGLLLLSYMWRIWLYVLLGIFFGSVLYVYGHNYTFH